MWRCVSLNVHTYSFMFMLVVYNFFRQIYVGRNCWVRDWKAACCQHYGSRSWNYFTRRHWCELILMPLQRLLCFDCAPLFWCPVPTMAFLLFTNAERNLMKFARYTVIISRAVKLSFFQNRWSVCNNGLITGDRFLYDVLERWIDINHSVRYYDVLCFRAVITMLHIKLTKQNSVIIHSFSRKKHFQNLVKTFIESK